MLVQVIECMTPTIPTIMFGDPMRTDITAAGWANVTTSTAIFAGWSPTGKRNTGPGVTLKSDWLGTESQKLAQAAHGPLLAAAIFAGLVCVSGR